MRLSEILRAAASSVGDSSATSMSISSCNHEQSLRNTRGNRFMVGIACVLTLTCTAKAACTLKRLRLALREREALQSHERTLRNIPASCQLVFKLWWDRVLRSVVLVSQ